MDGFIRQVELGECNHSPDKPKCSKPTDVMGYKTAADIPNYWAYAKNFVLQDRMFEPTRSWSLPSHLFMVSGWSALCARPLDPSTCQSDLLAPDPEQPDRTPDYGWTDLTCLLHKHHVSWRYYVAEGTQPDCDDGAMTCAEETAGGDGRDLEPAPRLRHRAPGRGARQHPDGFPLLRGGPQRPPAGGLVGGPERQVQRAPPALVSDGQFWVTSLINTVMRGPDWKSTAIFVSWDDWGGFYDHVNPPVVDGNGYGLRVPGLVISPYAKRGYIDHQTLSFDAYLKFIEDDFLGGRRLDPKTDGRPDPRPTVRERVSVLGDLRNDFDFSQPPRPPLILPPR